MKLYFFLLLLVFISCKQNNKSVDLNCYSYAVSKHHLNYQSDIASIKTLEDLYFKSQPINELPNKVSPLSLEPWCSDSGVDGDFKLPNDSSIITAGTSIFIYKKSTLPTKISSHLLLNLPL